MAPTELNNQTLCAFSFSDTMSEGSTDQPPDLPLEVLIRIFGYLNRGALFQVLQVSRIWYRAAQDNLLWKGLFFKDFKPRVKTIRDESSSWQAEYQRLCRRVPNIHWQTLKQHSNEVLHVRFSHSGDQLVSCSKDNRFIVWTLNIDLFSPHFVQDMTMYEWRHTWASQFNSTDSLLMVSGVVSEVNGEIAIFRTGRAKVDKGYSFLCRIINNPYGIKRICFFGVITAILFIFTFQICWDVGATKSTFCLLPYSYTQKMLV